jgi:hypothetical protein
MLDVNRMLIGSEASLCSFPGVHRSEASGALVCSGVPLGDNETLFVDSESLDGKGRGGETEMESRERGGGAGGGRGRKKIFFFALLCFFL